MRRHGHRLCKRQYNYGDTDRRPDRSHRQTSPLRTPILIAPPQITDTDTSSAKANISAAPQITDTNTSSAKFNISAAPQITDTDSSSANANKTAAPQITHTASITAASRVHLTHFRDPFRQDSPLWRAWRPSRTRLRTVADGCNRKRNFWRTQPHPQTPRETGTLATHSGKKDHKNQKGKSS